MHEIKYMQRAMGANRRWLSNIIRACQHSLCSSSTLGSESVWIFCTVCEAHLLICYETNARGRWERVAHGHDHSDEAFPKIPQQSAEIQSYRGNQIGWDCFLEWHRRFDLKSDGYLWWCFFCWIIGWVTQDIHTPLRGSNVSVRSPEEEQRDQTKYSHTQSQWLSDLSGVLERSYRSDCKWRHLYILLSKWKWF